MSHNVYIYLIIMATVTLAIRILPLTLVQKQFKSQFVKSFLYYVPYVTLSVMTFPAIFQATQSPFVGIIAFIIGIMGRAGFELLTTTAIGRLPCALKPESPVSGSMSAASSDCDEDSPLVLSASGFFLPPEHLTAIRTIITMSSTTAAMRM